MISPRIDYLLSPTAIRMSCSAIYDACENGGTSFKLNPEELPRIADLVIEVMRDNYPDMKVPFHSRARHLNTGNIDRVSSLFNGTEQDPLERCRKLLDLVVVSVLLDAGAGNQWTYFEESTGKTWNRSEGLAVASFHMFQQGLFSMNYQAEVNQEALQRLPSDSLAHGFQVSDSTPITGLDGRRQLLNNLGKTIADKAEFFPGGRPGGLLDYILDKHQGQIDAAELLKIVLLAYGDIWPSRHSLDQQSLGDAWPHPLLAKEVDEAHRFVVFHKLSQWLTYSLMEPLQDAGIEIDNIDSLTGLAEYRNGGLFLDGNVIQLRDPELMKQGHSLDSQVIIEWRALTVVLLDKVAELIREKLNEDEQSMPLVKILEGGTWWAGRRLAQERRPDCSPPLKLISDGTIF